MEDGGGDGFPFVYPLRGTSISLLFVTLRIDASFAGKSLSDQGSAAHGLEERELDIAR
jgi:hypothetical protein